MSATNNTDAQPNAVAVSGTVYTSTTGVLVKSFAVGPDGRILKSGGVPFATGTATRFDLGGGTAGDVLERLRGVLDRLTHYQAIGLGVEKNGLRETRVTTKGRAAHNGLPSRSLDHWGYAEGAGFWCADCDGGTGFNVKAASVYPPWEEVATLTRGSCSAGISNPITSERLSGSGEHAFVVVDDLSRAKEAAIALDRLFWCNGHGYVMVAANGALLRRSPIDLAVFSPERVLYEGPARVTKPLVAAPRLSVLRAGTMLDAAALVAYADKHAPVEAADAAFRAACQHPDVVREAALKRAEWRSARIDEHVAAGVEREAAEAIVDEFLKSGRSSSRDGLHFYAYVLGFDYVIALDDGTTVTPRTILADARKWAGRTLPDPIEGVAYGAGKAVIVAGKEGRDLYISSFAHGRCVYQLGRLKRPDPRQGDDFDRDEGGVIYASSQRNIGVALAKMGVTLSHDTFAEQLHIDGLDGFGPVFSDAAVNRLWLAIDERFHFRPRWQFFVAVVNDTAFCRPFNPPRDYLNSLDWDGTARIETWAVTYLGAEDTVAHRVFGRHFLIAGVARVMDPGCKADNMLILEGPQDILKSTALRKLAGDPWFSDEVHDIGSKDAAMQIAGRWIVELSELDAMNKAEVTKVKSWLTRTDDKFRPPYGRYTITHPRSCVIAGTTNASHYLRDETGGRRFWSIACGTIDIVGLVRDRDQLWAEAVHQWQNGAEWWLTDKDHLAAARTAQEHRRQPDPWESVIAGHVERFSLSEVTADTILGNVLDIEAAKRTPRDQQRVGSCLRAIGWICKYPKDAKRKTYRLWVKPETQEETDA